jgi:hypothetical protein
LFPPPPAPLQPCLRLTTENKNHTKLRITVTMEGWRGAIVQRMLHRRDYFISYTDFPVAELPIWFSFFTVDFLSLRRCKTSDSMAAFFHRKP